jgi:hypothetical protein
MLARCVVSSIHALCMHVASGACEHPTREKITFHWTLFPDKNLFQVQADSVNMLSSL